jgi:hypothetical protein
LKNLNDFKNLNEFIERAKGESEVIIKITEEIKARDSAKEIVYKFQFQAGNLIYFPRRMLRRFFISWNSDEEIIKRSLVLLEILKRTMSTAKRIDSEIPVKIEFFSKKYTISEIEKKTHALSELLFIEDRDKLKQELKNYGVFD